MGVYASYNQTTFTHFILLGFSDLPPELEQCLLGTLLCVYLIILVGNILIIILVTLEPCLQTPMYFFLKNLSFMEIFFISITVPRTLVTFILRVYTISFIGCAFQMFLFFIVGVSECLFLAVMAYDRYLAICNPLLYSATMTPKMCVGLVSATWAWGMAVSFGQTSFIFSWSYCRSTINHFFCDSPAVLLLACSDTFLNQITVYIAYVVGGFFPFALIFFSYFKILSTILRMTSSAGRRKTFSTCSSHMLSVGLFYGSTMFIYLHPTSEQSLGRDKLLSLLHTVVIPLLNPLIYSLRNKEMKGAFRRLVYRIHLNQFKL